MNNPFFKNNGPFKIDKLLKLSNIKNIDYLKNIKVKDIKDLSSAKANDITFFHSKKYETIANNTKASFCITTDNLKKYLPKKCKIILTNNVLLTKQF